MYRLGDSLLSVNGIGPKLFASFEEEGFHSVRDLLMHLPFRYEDRSEHFTIDQNKPLAQSKEKKLFTLEAIVKSSRSAYVRGKTMQSATLVDETGQITASWFNNPYIVKRLKTDASYLFSGTVSLSKKGQIYLTQPIVEDVNKESIHTNRLVPIYSTIPGVLPTILRKFQKEILDHLEDIPDLLEKDLTLSLTKALKIIHFPDLADQVVEARERFAIEELILLIQHSQTLKEEWKREKTTVQIKDSTVTVPQTIPFELTGAQIRCAQEICVDLTDTAPMNRLLIGDVGSGKTIVAGLAMTKIVEAGFHTALVAPTQILAEQHAKTLAQFFPNIPIYVVTGKLKTEFFKPGIIVGTHAVLNVIKKLREANEGTAIGLVVFDEQHRFGVRQRSELVHLGIHPHLLTMTATPIPRSLMLSIFSHLSLSTIDELPKNRIPTKTWLITENKRDSMYKWIEDQVMDGKQKNQQFQVISVCPFINPSESEALENVAAAKEMVETIRKKMKSNKKIVVGALYSKLKKEEKSQVITDLFAGKIDILVSTPIVEVGVDLPQAAAIVIEAAERFGLASLHQLRGRVGRAGQQGYCLLFTSNKNSNTGHNERLKKFETISNGQELAELDLKNRGAGDLFGTQQHGFDDLKFASWTDFSLIKKAKDLADRWKNQKEKYHSPLLQRTSHTKILAN